MDIPVYRFLIDEDEEALGMVGISLVESPAMESSFLVFNKQKKPIRFVENKKYKQVLTGLAIIPDLPIYRKDEELGEYYGVFSVEEVEKIRNKFHKQKFTDNVNLDHNSKSKVNGYVIESYILNSDLRLQEAESLGLTDAVSGAWVISLKIEDEDVFNDVLEGKYTGFSIESFLNLEKFSIQKNNINKKEDKMKSKFQSLKEKILNIFEDVQEFEKALVPELGFTIEWTEVGQTVSKITSQEGEEDVTEPVGEGEYTLEDGRVVVVDESSNLVEIKDAPEEDVEVEMTKANGKYVKGEEVIEAEVSYTEVDAPVLIDDQPIQEVVEIEETVEVELESGTTLVVGEDGLLDEVKEEGEVVIEDEDSTEDFNKKKFGDENKRLKELLGDKAGEYYISVTIDEEGNYVWGNVSAYNALEFKSEHTKETRKLQKEIKKLKEKLGQPIADPVLTNQNNGEEVDLSKMSKYDRLMHKKGLESPFKK